MAKKKRPSIERFREFVREHPHLRNEVKQKQTTWQELFEEWYLLGESHPRWKIDQNHSESNTRDESNQAETQKEAEQSKEFIGMVLGAIKNMDINQIQQYIKSANQALGTIQGLLEMFQGSNNTTNTKEESSPPKPEVEQRKNPFMFRKD